MWYTQCFSDSDAIPCLRTIWKGENTQFFYKFRRILKIIYNYLHAVDCWYRSTSRAVNIEQSVKNADMYPPKEKGRLRTFSTSQCAECMDSCEYQSWTCLTIRDKKAEIVKNLHKRLGAAKTALNVNPSFCLSVQKLKTVFLSPIGRLVCIIKLSTTIRHTCRIYLLHHSSPFCSTDTHSTKLYPLILTLVHVVNNVVVCCLMFLP